ncbi:unnamed protein product [Rhodiola kirilowii]
MTEIDLKSCWNQISQVKKPSSALRGSYQFITRLKLYIYGSRIGELHCN